MYRFFYLIWLARPIKAGDNNIDPASDPHKETGKQRDQRRC